MTTTTPTTRATAVDLDGPLGATLVQVLRGNPSPEELAAVTAVLITMARGHGEAEPERPPAGGPTWQPPLPAGCSYRSWKARR
ncbi:hypothetical protein GKQ77_03630 [Streptomyces sp. BG9H]|uniref:Acyl-CoA carboxylase subunit epsilon n=1 Tax=Streptomyces anatolicus TaxID=2675858 RepID=A0ABS6YGX7_9ACTN|nr:acyl-CoA carboxylase subunit epsilon [Streptomyces anatolicus]MBW5420661.1 hypothetical protein [Streptomyces anatolicus]